VAGQLVLQAGDTNAEGVMTREVQWMLHWVLVSLYSRLVQNPGAAANYNSKRKKGFKKEKGVKAFLLKKESV
jgi:hypothetical protein